jgi:hypothetical protein
MSAATWTRDADRSVWVAECRGALLAVTRLAVDRWQAEVRRDRSSDEPGERSPVCRTRLAAQAWAERTAQARGLS